MMMSASKIVFLVALLACIGVFPASVSSSSVSVSCSSHEFLHIRLLGKYEHVLSGPDDSYFVLTERNVIGKVKLNTGDLGMRQHSRTVVTFRMETRISRIR